MSSVEKKQNHLASEKSPYLLQHVHNPVDWYPWGKEAFDKAKKENKPIFLSIGYSSCHWCHVMERESFENPDIAKLMNDNFVCIKVDREERPEVDEIYMKAVVAMTGSGGWPLNVFLTPNLEPFYGGTYFPPSNMQGIPSFSNVLNNVARAWKSDRKTINESASQMRQALTQIYKNAGKADQSKIDTGVLDEAYASLSIAFDKEYGGFGRAPKFPVPSDLFFLMRYYNRTNQRFALQMVMKTLDSIASGGIHDQLGGGFHRYSTDRYWLVPHFEKMLYDNALLAAAYTEAFQITKNQRYQDVVRDALNWVLRDMTSKEGGFFSAIDADSPGGEGSYYVWSKKEFLDALKSGSESDSKIMTDYYSVTQEGNFEDGKTILTSSKSVDQIAISSGLDVNKVRQTIKRSSELLLSIRAKRPAPSVDDKILTGWNGLMISAFAKAYEVFDEGTYLSAARRAADFILSKLTTQKEGKLCLMRRYRDGEVKEVGVLEDYAFFINGLIDLYEASFEPAYFEKAIALCESMIQIFYDNEAGGFYLSPADTPSLIARPKDAYDGALPSGNSVASLVLLRLAEFTGNDDHTKKAEATFVSFSSQLSAQPQAYCHMLVAVDFYLSNRKEIVVAGNTEEAITKELIRILRGEFMPVCVIARADEKIQKLVPLVEGRIPSNEHEKPKIYVCTNRTCKLPSHNPDELLSALKS